MATIDHVTSMLARRSEMLVRLLEDLATVHELDRGALGVEFQRVVLTDACRDVLAEHRSRIGDSLVVDIATDAVVLADPVRIVQILDNLLSNAARYGGNHVTLQARRDGSVVRISVIDDGAGVPEDLVGTIFDMYSRGAASSHLGGSGLGLAIVQQLCRALGGTIEYSHTDVTRFTATLPAVQQVAVELGADAARKGHSVAFWVDDQTLAESVAKYIATGLALGEAALVAMTWEHRTLVEAELGSLGIDVEAVLEIGQYVPIDATKVHDALRVDGHIDPEVFTKVVGGAVDAVRERWQTFRVFGEIVDLYWREGDGHLALELESCWNELRGKVQFPLYCGYEIAPNQDKVCDCHEAVLVA